MEKMTIGQLAKRAGVNIKMLPLNEEIHIPAMYTYGHSNVRFYAFLFVSSCRFKRNYPAAETERIFENRYRGT